MQNLESAVDKNNFLNRLASLQRLCSDYDKNYPKALLFVPGTDGRNNKGSISVLKYLLLGSVGKDLFDETLDTIYESLEEIIILIKQSSFFIIFSHEAKKLLSPILYNVPFLIEYLTTKEEEDDIDLLQAKKCCDFKRMMLESLQDGEGLGIPIPIGYDDIHDIESWPILQEFARDSVYCPTGFFTAKYHIADISTQLDILFRTLDGYYLEQAIGAVNRTISSHVLQCINMLNTSTADQRMRITADDFVGPLEILYDFGEMEAAGVVDPSTKPIALFGVNTSLFGALTGPYPNNWHQKTVGDSLHTILEGFEPSIGLRWCRTYFLHRGRVAISIETSNIYTETISSATISNDDASNYDKIIERKLDEKEIKKKYNIPMNTSIAIQRLESIYMKLLISLRLLVKSSFSIHNDVLEAGTEIQKSLDYIMKGCNLSNEILNSNKNIFELNQWKSLHLNAPELILQSNEKLQVHMDCINSIGEIVAIEDVDDMGGSCWTYIRVAVHGILLNAYSNQPVTVAVGDTFLFSSHRYKLQVLHDNTNKSFNDNHQLLLHGDSYCITHILPYYRSFISSGAEEMSSQRLLSCARTTHILSTLGLGKGLDNVGAGSGVINITTFTDHPVIPYFDADLKLFTDGFIIEKMNNSACIPILISMENHIDHVWSIDVTDFIQESTLLFPQLNNRDLDSLSSSTTAMESSGLIIIFRLKTTLSYEGDIKHGMFLNPLERSMPLIGSMNLLNKECAVNNQQLPSCRHIAFLIRSDSRITSSMNEACSYWRKAMRMYEVHEHKGKDVPIPTAILLAYLSYLDDLKDCSATYNVMNNYDMKSNPNKVPNQNLISTSFQSLLRFTQGFALNQISLSTNNYFSMRCIHTVSDAQRLTRYNNTTTSSNNNETNQALSCIQTIKQHHNTKDIIVLNGLPGFGIYSFSFLLAQQLADVLDLDMTPVKLITIDFTTLTSLSIDINEVIKFVEYCMTSSITVIPSTLVRSNSSNTNTSTKKKELILVSIVLSPVLIVPMSNILIMLSTIFQIPISLSISLVVPPNLDINEVEVNKSSIVHRYASKSLQDSGYGLGYELWKSMSIEVLHLAASDLVLVMDDAMHESSSYYALRSYYCNINPSGQLIRITPTNLRLNTDHLEVILGYINKLTINNDNDIVDNIVSERQAYGIIRGYPSYYSNNLTNSSESSMEYFSIMSGYIPKQVNHGIQIIELTPSSLGIDEWDLSNLINTIHLLFPKAKYFGNNIQNSWKIPKLNTKQNKNTFRRMVQLATVKVMSIKQDIYNKNKNLNDINIIKIKEKHLLDQLINNIKSITCTIITSITDTSMFSTNSPSHNQSFPALQQDINHQNKILEANLNFITLRSFNNNIISNNKLTNKIIINGILNHQEIILLKQLFQSCMKNKLKLKNILTKEDIPEGLRYIIQTNPKYNALFKIPSGWWYDGQYYLNINGLRKLIRPDINDLIDLYLIDENKRIIEYNQLLVDL